MRNTRYFLIALICLCSTLTFAQIPEIGKQKKCYERYDASGNVIPPSERRYAEWQCGKTVGVVDCNERLEYDEGTDIVYLNNNDMANAAGANKPFTGKCETCHMNGIIERRVSFVGGKTNGIDTTYYPSGCPKVIRSHVQGVETGTWYYHFDSTQYLAWEMNYQVGEKHGKHIFFRKNGDTIRWENYNNGLLHGTKRTYYTDSKIKSEVEYINGNLEGSYKTYNRKGQIIQDLIYKQGKKNDEAKYYYDDGVLLKTEHWDMGVKNGDFKMYYYQGNIQTEETFKKGKHVGWWKEYYPDGTTKHTILYDKKSVKIEEHKYDEQGRETYAFGTPDSSENEDDEMPTDSKKKKKKKRKKD